MAMMKRRARRYFAFVAMLGLLFAQLSLTAYACPKQGGDIAAPTSAVPVMTDCADLAATQPDANLCEVHCQDGVKSTPTTASDVPPALVSPILLASSAATLQGIVAHRSNAVRDATAAGPPLPIRFCRFLI